MFSPPLSTRVSDSLGSNPASPASTKTSTTDGSSDMDYGARAYIKMVLENGGLKDTAEGNDCASSDFEYNSKSFLLESGLKEERFRIDRKKLEDMLQTEQTTNTDIENAETFFQKVMVETTTQISWPSKLKIGAKSKKDPHVKIIGKPEAVQMAKERILEILDTKKNRVTLKMDVSYSDHSYAIGKGGFKIQQVMEETACHIHFPDSNRNNSVEKSNQVSIAGQAAGVEKARAKIRELLPLVFTFELNSGESINPGEESSPAVQHIQQTYSFNVAFRPIGPVGMGRTLLVVRGCQRLLPRLRQGLALLMQYLTGSKTIPVNGFMKTEIAAQHHSFVMGPNNVKIQMIQNKTGATIIFPECPPFGADNPPPLPLIAGHSILRSKSTVLIHGSFDSVCLAWQELLKCLPLVLMFDLKEGQELDPVMVNNFMETYNINIMLRPKTKENTKSVLIRGAEKDSRILFQVRKDILELEDEESCPQSPTFKRHESAAGYSCIHNLRMQPQGHDLKENKKPVMTTAESLNIISNIIQQNPQIVGLLNNLSAAPTSTNIEMAPQAAHSPVHRNVAFQNGQSQLVPNHLTRKVESWINRPDRSYAYASGVNVSKYLQKDRELPVDDGDSGIFMLSNGNRFFGNNFSTKSEFNSQPGSSASSTSSNDTPDFKYRCTHKEPTFSDGDVHHLLTDYGNKKLGATAAMQQPIEGVRTPTLQWSGFGFSKSMPDFNARNKRTPTTGSSISEYLEADNACAASDAATSSVWSTDSMDRNVPSEPTSPFSFSNFWENLPRKPPINYGSIKTLDQLLSHLNLEQYNEIFERHEVDLTTFLSLTENDLCQLNISYGVRRKMLVTISALREQRMGDWSQHTQFRAAPGAERRSMVRYSADSSSEHTPDRPRMTS